MSYLIYPSNCPSFFLKQPVLPLKCLFYSSLCFPELTYSLFCPWICLYFRLCGPGNIYSKYGCSRAVRCQGHVFSTAVSAVPGHVCSPANCAFPRHVCFTGRPAENVTNIGVNKISAPAKISMIFAKLQQSIYLLTGVLQKIGENKKWSPSLSNISSHNLQNRGYHRDTALKSLKTPKG